MTSEELRIIKDCAYKTRQYLLSKYGKDNELAGTCKEAASLMIGALKFSGIKASKHFGWCIYDSCDSISGEPCAPHCYVLVHDGKKRLYLDCTATQFSFALNEPIPELILLHPGVRPYWFRATKPNLKDMEITSGYM